jgi:hypothetical protein
VDVRRDADHRPLYAPAVSSRLLEQQAERGCDAAGLQLRERLGSDGGIGDYVPKPLWMRWAIYDRRIERRRSTGNSRQAPEIMPRDGALTLSDVREPTLTIVCEPCSRRGRYDVGRLMTEYGDAKLTDLLVMLANCRKTHSANVHDRCKAVYNGLSLG